LLGNEFDALVLLTNYQTAKNISPFSLQILQTKYLTGSEISDLNLCILAKNLREKYNDSQMLQKLVRFLAYVNQSDWEAKWILKIINLVLVNENNFDELLNVIRADFNRNNIRLDREGKVMMSEDSLQRLLNISEITPRVQGVIRAVDDWVIITQKDNGRFPNENEWHRFLTSPLNGKIGMSFALQWRYNFRALFNNN
jgi:hypothetical protein